MGLTIGLALSISLVEGLMQYIDSRIFTHWDVFGYYLAEVSRPYIAGAILVLIACGLIFVWAKYYLAASWLSNRISQAAFVVGNTTLLVFGFLTPPVVFGTAFLACCREAYPLFDFQLFMVGL